MTERITFTEELIPGHLTILSFSAREMYIEKMGELFDKHEDYCFVSAETTSHSGKMLEVRGKAPERFLEVGVAEANQVGVAAGLALAGKTVFMQGFGPFFALRALDQIHTDIAYHNLPVRIINTHSGLTSGGGPTHYNIMDLAILRIMPNMIVEVPADANQCLKAIEATEGIAGPINIRIPRGAEPLVYTTQDYEYVIGKAITAVEGTDITIIACGTAMALAVSAANGLAKEGISARVLDMHTISPLDKDAIIKAAKETGNIITVEDHFVDGGLGGAVAEVIADEKLNVNFKRLGIPTNAFPSLGDMNELYAFYGYDSAGIKKTAKEMLGK